MFDQLYLEYLLQRRLLLLDKIDKIQFIAKNTHTSYNGTGKKSATIFFIVYYLYVLWQLGGDLGIIPT